MKFNSAIHMKHYISLLLTIIISALSLFSCDKMDCNDGLDGQWQMIEWTSATGEFVGDKHMRIYYCFQLQMMTFQMDGKWQSSSFENKGSSIRVYDPISYAGNGKDNILDMGVLSKYGVPNDGIMKVETLTSNRLVLSSKQYGTLTFRKF